MKQYALGQSHWPGAAKVIEETSRLNVTLAKLMGAGGNTNHGNSIDLDREILYEAADSIAAIQFFCAANFEDEQLEYVSSRIKYKIGLLTGWHNASDEKE